MSQALESLYDHVDADLVLTATCILIAAAAVTLALQPHRSPRPLRRLGLVVACGLALTTLSNLVSSAGYSGDSLRTRYGLPHFCAESHYDPFTATVVDRFTLIPVYALLDLAFWFALALLFAALLGWRGSAPAKSTSLQ
jgi:hypothetical protein